ncbi:hypothetical protein DdX_08036 [Ditylenchus destructor]|uniref:Uncharacterized protein n=1 Tax=Ditylenchus destructor TaxID=166010 RepID=A0AAD4N734_9BILA|nr:hypothetical protein DdX_08036 [Ditylenchus destructor]
MESALPNPAINNQTVKIVWRVFGLVFDAISDRLSEIRKRGQPVNSMEPQLITKPAGRMMRMIGKKHLLFQ